MKCEDIKSGKKLVMFREGINNIRTVHTSKGLEIILV
jgi:hypothetical protein